MGIGKSSTLWAVAARATFKKLGLQRDLPNAKNA